MSKLSRIPAVTLATALLLSSIVARAADGPDESADALSAQQLDAAAPAPWPVQAVDSGRTFLIYQPQVDRWNNGRLEGRSAVTVHDGAGRQNFGVVYFSARAETDPASRMVTISDPEISRIDFPAVPADAGNYLSVLRAQFAGRSWTIAQDRLQSDMEIDRLAQQTAKQPLKNDPPQMLYSDRPAVLVPVDGDPVLRPVGDTGLSRVMNTRALLLQDKSASRYYLFVSDHWMQAQSLAGPWSAANPMAQLDQAKQLATQQDEVDLLEADAAEGAAPTVPPAIFVSTAPAELLQTDGPPQYAPIEHTQLLYVTNSPDKLFLDLATQNYYALISGRWYRATALAQGQWSHVAPSGLPADFAMIPSDHPTQSVRAAVPGTPQAREAVIASTVPQMATVSRSAGHLEIDYDGSPQFQPIEGTALQNAINSPVPVIRVDENAFYALDNGVWFAGPSPFGPWAITAYVPSVIYSIPRSSPLYYVTYVRVYDSTPDVVYVGYTPGYVGSYVSNDVVVYGTGWPYRPWIGNVWYGAPVTWGFGFSFFHSWWNPYPWNYWHRTAWMSPRPFYHPWWGPWHASAHGRPGFTAAGVHAVRPFAPGARNVGRIYDRWDRRSVVWNGPRTIADQQRPAPRAAPGNGFVAGPDPRWRRLGEAGDRDRRDVQTRGNAANPRGPQTTRPAQLAPAVQTPWRRGPAPALAGNDRWQPDQRRADNAILPPRVDARPAFDRSRAEFQPNRPAQGVPRAQSPQRMPPVAGVPIERAPSQFQRAMAPARNSSQLHGHVERPTAISGRIERPVAASPGRNVGQSFARPQVGANEAHGHSNSGGRGGGDRNR